MASHYDPKKKCRVGTMDEKQFYQEADKPHGVFFRRLIAAWESAGGGLRWGAGGVGLRGPVGGKETGICFLAPQFAGKHDRIELACTALAKQIGANRMKQLQGAIRAAAEAKVLGSTMISIVQPGGLDAGGQKALIAAFVGLLES